LARHEVDGNKISARARIGVIIPSIAVIPVLVPGTAIIGQRRLQQMALKATAIVILLEMKLLIVGDSVMGCFSSAGGW
jgi:hypothetical protein